MTSTYGGRGRRVLSLAVVTAAALTLAGCGGGLGSSSSSTPAASGDTSPIVLGMVTPTSGSSSAIGPYMSNGAQLAINEINGKGGVLGRQLKLDVQDEACDPKTAVAAANKLVSDKVVASVGGYCSGATLPTLPVFARANIPVVIPAANSDDLVKAGQKNVFLINGTGTQQAAAAVKWMIKAGATKVALMDDNTSYSKNIAVQTSKDLGSNPTTKVVKSESVTAGESDYSANVTSVLSAQPDFIYWTGYYQEGGLIIRQLRQAGYKGNIMVADGAVDQQLIAIAGPAQAEGVFATMTQTPDTIPGAEGWVASYKKTFNADPGPYSTQSYDAVRVVTQAITDAKSTDGQKVITALGNINGLKLFSGLLKFTPEHTLSSGGFLILSVQNGKLALKDALQ